MKRQILNLGFPATHDSIVTLPNLNDRMSISDFDAFIFDPILANQVSLTSETYIRRQQEIRDLVSKKGGVALCVMRQNANLAISGGQTDVYTLFNAVSINVAAQIRQALRSGWGSQMEMLPGAKGAAVGYLRVLSGKMRFAAYLDSEHASLRPQGGTVLAVDSVGHPIAVEFVVDSGRICILPVPDGIAGDRVGAAIVRVIDAHYGGPTEIESPLWSLQIDVPSATANDARIAELEFIKEQLETETGDLKRKRSDVLNYRFLLYGYGKSMLEPVVRSAFRLLGFGVPEPEEYTGEWDIELTQPSSSNTAIGEIEGSTGIIDVDKYRQLLDYVQAEVLEGREHKGILIGNGFRLTAPEEAERQNQFSEHALRGAKKNEFCLVPATELFKAVCAVLEFPTDEARKIAIRHSILSTVGVWTYARENTQADAQVGSSTTL